MAPKVLAYPLSKWLSDACQQTEAIESIRTMLAYEQAQPSQEVANTSGESDVQPNSELVSLRQELKDIGARYKALRAEHKQLKEEHEELYKYHTKSVDNIHTLQSQMRCQNTVNDMLLQELAAIREMCSPGANLPESYEKAAEKNADIDSLLPRSQVKSPNALARNDQSREAC